MESKQTAEKLNEASEVLKLKEENKRLSKRPTWLGYFAFMLFAGAIRAFVLHNYNQPKDQNQVPQHVAASPTLAPAIKLQKTLTGADGLVHTSQDRGTATTEYWSKTIVPLQQQAVSDELGVDQNSELIVSQCLAELDAWDQILNRVDAEPARNVDLDLIGLVIASVAEQRRYSQSLRQVLKPVLARGSTKVTLEQVLAANGLQASPTANPSPDAQNLAKEIMAAEKDVNAQPLAFAKMQGKLIERYIGCQFTLPSN